MSLPERSYEEHLRLKVDELQAEIQKLREALAFYADPSHWDGGRKAKDALE